MPLDHFPFAAATCCPDHKGVRWCNDCGEARTGLWNAHQRDSADQAFTNWLRDQFFDFNGDHESTYCPFCEWELFQQHRRGLEEIVARMRDAHARNYLINDDQLNHLTNDDSISLEERRDARSQPNHLINDDSISLVGRFSGPRAARNWRDFGPWLMNSVKQAGISVGCGLFCLLRVIRKLVHRRQQRRGLFRDGNGAADRVVHGGQGATNERREDHNQHNDQGESNEDQIIQNRRSTMIGQNGHNVEYRPHAVFCCDGVLLCILLKKKFANKFFWYLARS